ncbi:MAG: hypothetical protein U0X91_05360 [Spirosomataceae bacterium]
MKLTTEQLELISKEVIEGGIKYQDLYEELLDHYITAIEDRVENGKTFGEAFGEVHEGFTNYKLYLGSFYYYDARRFRTVRIDNYGLVKLQNEYKERLNKEMAKRHWQIMKNYFRWPTLVTTLLVGLLTFQFAYLVPREYFIWIISTCAFAPVLIVLPQAALHLGQYFIKKRKFINSLKTNAIIGRSAQVFFLVYWIIQLPKYFSDYDLIQQGHIAIIASFTCFYIAYSLSFYQLYRERFKVNRA